MRLFRSSQDFDLDRFVYRISVNCVLQGFSKRSFLFCVHASVPFLPFCCFRSVSTPSSRPHQHGALSKRSILFRGKYASLCSLPRQVLFSFSLAGSLLSSFFLSFSFVLKSVQRSHSWSSPFFSAFHTEHVKNHAVGLKSILKRRGKETSQN
jgi:hypothetical protein